MAIVLVNPFDVVKTKFMIQGQLNQGAAPYRGIADAFAQIARADGLRGLQAGLAPSCLWQFSNVSCRFGVYALAKKVTNVSEETSPLKRWLKSLGLAGCSGACGAVVSNPFFIVKTRLQAASVDPALAVGEHREMRGVLGCLADIYRSDGISGYWRGVSSFTLRVVAASAAQLSTYDAAKDFFATKVGLDRAVTSTHVCASLVAGMAMALAMQPFDFACTRLVNSHTAAERVAATRVKGEVTFSGPLDVLRRTVATEGFFGIYKGLLPNYMRLAPYNILVFAFVERLRELEETFCASKTY